MRKYFKIWGHEVTLNTDTNELTGDTFKIKKEIKSMWSGKWNSENKSWVIDAERFLLNSNVVECEKQVKEGSKATNKNQNKVCPKCGTYCFGDCEA